MSQGHPSSRFKRVGTELGYYGTGYKIGSKLSFLKYRRYLPGRWEWTPEYEAAVGYVQIHSRGLPPAVRTPSRLMWVFGYNFHVPPPLKASFVSSNLLYQVVSLLIPSATVFPKILPSSILDSRSQGTFGLSGSHNYLCPLTLFLQLERHNSNRKAKGLLIFKWLSIFPPDMSWLTLNTYPPSIYHAARPNKRSRESSPLLPSIARRITPISRAMNAVNAALIGPNDYKKKGGERRGMRMTTMNRPRRT